MISDSDCPRVIRGLEENLWSFWKRFGMGPGCALHQTEFATWFDTPIPAVPYNTVLRFASENEAESRIDDILAYFAHRGVIPAWIIHPSAQPRDLEEMLRRRGLEEAEVVQGMAMDLERLPEVGGLGEGIHIEEIHDLGDVGDYLDLVAWRWEVPPSFVHHLVAMANAFDIGTPNGPVRLWIGRKNGRAVSKIALNLDNGVAGIYAVATYPEARGLGLARALTVNALHAARAAGFTLAVLHSTPMAVSLYEGIGFRPYAPFKVFAPPNSLHL